MKELKSWLNKLEKEFDELMGKLNLYNVSPSEAYELAAKFLSASYAANKAIRDISNELIIFDLQEKTAYKDAIEKIDNKVNVIKTKAIASADKAYLSKILKKQQLEGLKSYWRGCYDIFNNAHIFYRNVAKD